ncbi:MAG: LytTR family DNA-binding domain-containing protein [Thermonemataceae bacterium]|nr:LytTR family DNA-binding domain-containing protein [Thermonemataceae bacterium]
MKAIIVDDEPMARKALANILRNHFPEVNILSECKNVPEAVQAITLHQPDIVFLDIEMPEYDGFSLLKFFRPEHINFHIIFITAYNQYALQAFEASATDYLLKPLRIEHLERALKKISTSTNKNKQKYEVFLHNLITKNEKKIVLHNMDNIFVLNASDIIYLEADGSYTNIVSSSHPDILMSKKLSSFDYLESFAYFFRSHRSFLININKIKRIDKKNFIIEMKNDAAVYLAQERKNELLQRLHDLNERMDLKN